MQRKIRHSSGVTAREARTSACRANAWRPTGASGSPSTAARSSPAASFMRVPSANWDSDTPRARARFVSVSTVPSRSPVSILDTSRWLMLAYHAGGEGTAAVIKASSILLSSLVFLRRVSDESIKVIAGPRRLLHYRRLFINYLANATPGIGDWNGQIDALNDGRISRGHHALGWQDLSMWRMAR